VRVTAGGISVNYTVDGPDGARDGAPWVVLSNSLATTLDMWEGQVPALAQSFRVLRYDQRGHGETDSPDGPYSFDLLVSDLEALLDALDIPRAHVVGLSMGGATALGLALRRPERVGLLVICDTSAASTPEAARQWAARAAVAAEQGMAALVEPTIERWFPAETVAANPPHLDLVRQMIKSTPVAGFRGGAAALSEVDYASAVTSVSAPTLFVVGERDGGLPRAMRSLHAQLPASQFAELPGAGHLSNLDAPADFNAAVVAFLSDSGG
jgi:3-oxoadipate enol-lactonase